MFAFLKQSGELLTDKPSDLWTPDGVYTAADRIAELYKNADALNLRGMMVVSGAGNVIRGAGIKGEFSSPNIRRVADMLGRLGTVQNTLMLSAALDDFEVPTQILMAPGMALQDYTLNGNTRPYSLEAAKQAYYEGRVVLMAGGTGRDNVTTDGAVLQYARESAEVNPDRHYVLKATKHNGIYSEDPRVNDAAQRYQTISAGYMLSDLDRFGAVDEPCLELMADAPDNLTMQVYAANKYTPYEVLSASSAVGTLVLAGEMEPVLA
jgi:uridylate kinase